MKYIMTFVFVCLLGLFTLWIGGVEPFTLSAGFGAFMTIIIAFVGVGAVYLIDLGGKKDDYWKFH